MTTKEECKIQSRALGAELGYRIGDALAMPVHWYYDRRALKRDYGTVADFVAPKAHHPDSIFWRSKWAAPSPELDILGDERPHWGTRGVHYHRNLSAGENTLTVKLATELSRSLISCGGFDREDYLRRYIALMTHPQRHGDTYIEECHRGFFTNLGRGKNPKKCAVAEQHISGLVMMLPVALYYSDREEEGRRFALECLSLTHAGQKMRTAAEAVLSLLYPVLHGVSLEKTILDECARQRNPHFGFPFQKWLNSHDEDVVGPRLSSACYVEDAVPAVIYLALKYSGRPEAALIANTNLGGDNVHRGSVLGAMMGADRGAECWPKRWVEGLLDWET